MKTILTTLIVSLGLSLAAYADKPINDGGECPVCRKTPRLIFWSQTREGRVAFCSKECKAKFDKNPGSYKVKKSDQ